MRLDGLVSKLPTPLWIPLTDVLVFSLRAMMSYPSNQIQTSKGGVYRNNSETMCRPTWVQARVGLSSKVSSFFRSTLVCPLYTAWHNYAHLI